MKIINWHEQDREPLEGGVEAQLENMKYMLELKASIVYYEGLYHEYMQEKYYGLADWARTICDNWTKLLKRYEDGILSQNPGGQVPQALHGGSKTVFLFSRNKTPDLPLKLTPLFSDFVWGYPA